MRITFPAHKRFPQMPSVVREQVNTRKNAAKPSRKQVDGQREAVHLGTERHHESRECAKGAPIAARTRMSETEREDGRTRPRSPPQVAKGHKQVHLYSLPSSLRGLFVVLSISALSTMPTMPSMSTAHHEEHHQRAQEKQ